MSIQWFPGHMASARKKAAETLEQVDVIIEVLDGRAPEASSNPMITELRLARQRPCLKVLNKVDLADSKTTQMWLDYYNAQPNVTAVALSAKNLSDALRVPKLCTSLAPHRDSAIKPLRMMIMGIPNVGKSTLMNTLLKKKVARVGDEPAVTKSQQRLEINSRQVLIDSPGMLWPKIEQPADGLILATIHAVGRNAVYEEEVALFFADLLLREHPEVLATRYKLNPAEFDAAGILEAIAEKRACRRKGNDGWDLEKAAMLFLTDYRIGKLGRISLETPETRAQLLAQYPAPSQQNIDSLEGEAEA